MKRAAPARGRAGFECVALLLQGGGALGAYQGGVYQALAEADLHPDWVAGISIGAINSAIIAGNPPAQRVAKLRAFWEGVTASSSWAASADAAARLWLGNAARRFFNQASVATAVCDGVPGFFAPRVPAPWLHPDGSIGATSWYETAKLRATLERLVDFERVNGGEMRVSVGAVNIRSGNLVYFDTETHVIRPEHVLASGALPPGFPAIEIEGERYWDGGLVSNTPLQWVLQDGPRQDTLAFQVDLWSARGELPRDMIEVDVRQKDIRFSSRTRASTDSFRKMQALRRAAAKLLDEMPKELRQSAEAELLAQEADHKVYNIIHLIYHARNYEGASKDYEFSRPTMEEHWKTGYSDMVRTLRHPEVLERPKSPDGVFTFDLKHQGREQEK
jgi:NTE family protein